MYFKKGDTFYPTVSFECIDEFTSEMYNELIDFVKYASEKAIKQDVVECETISKEEFDKLENELKEIEVHISEV